MPFYLIIQEYVNLKKQGMQAQNKDNDTLLINTKSGIKITEEKLNLENGDMNKSNNEEARGSVLIDLMQV